MTEFKRDHFGFYQTSSRKLKHNLRNTWEQDQTYNKSSGYHSMSSPSWINQIPEPVPFSIISSLFNCNYGETGDQGDEIALPTRPESVELTDDEGSEYIVPDRGRRRRRRGGGLRKQRKRCPKGDPILSADSEFVLYQDLSDSDMENGSRRRTFERSTPSAQMFETFSGCYPIPSAIQCIPPTTLFNIDDEFSCPCLLQQKVSRRRPFTNTNSSQGVAETSSEHCPRSSFTYPIDNDCSCNFMLPETSAFDYRASVITGRRIDHGDDRGRLPVIDEISTSESSSSPCLETLESKVAIKDTASIGEVHFDFSTKTSKTQPMQSDTLAVTCRSNSSSAFRISGHVSLTPADTASECNITTSEKMCKTTALNETRPENITEATGCGKQSLTKLAEHNSSESNLAALKLIILHSIDFGNPIADELDSKEGTEISERNSNVRQLMPSGCEGEPSVTTNLIDLGVNSGKEPSSCHNLKNEDEFHSAVDLKISEEICPKTGEKVQCTGPVSQYSSASSCNPQGNCVHEPIKKQNISSSCTKESSSASLCNPQGNSVHEPIKRQNISSSCTKESSSASLCNLQGNSVHGPIKKQNISSSSTKVSCTKESSSRESNRIQSEVQMHIPVEKSPNSKTKIVFASPVDSFKPLITERQDPAIISSATQHLDQRPGINIVKQTVSTVYYSDTKYVRLNTPLMCDQLPIAESRQSVSPKDGEWCRSIVQIQIALEPIPNSDSKAALEAPPMLENKRCTQLSKPSDNTLEGKANLHDYVKQYCDNSDKEERVYVIVIPSRISIGHDSLQMNNTTRVVSDPSVDIESVLSSTPCKARQLSLQSSEQTSDDPNTPASLVTHLSRITLILPEIENSGIVNSTAEINMEKTTTYEERKPRIRPDNVAGCCPPRVSFEGISDTETRATSTSQNVQNVDQSPKLRNEGDITARMRNFKYRTENLKKKINEVACNKQSRGVSQMPPPPPRKDDRFYITESSTYRPGPWPAQLCPLVPPLASRIKKELIDLAAEVSELEHEMARLQVALEEIKASKPEDDIRRQECPPCAKASQKNIKKRKSSRIEIKEKGRSKTESYDIREPIRIPSRILNPDALKDVQDTTSDVITKFNSRLYNYRSRGPRC